MIARPSSRLSFTDVLRRTKVQLFLLLVIGLLLGMTGLVSPHVTFALQVPFVVYYLVILARLAG